MALGARRSLAVYRLQRYRIFFSLAVCSSWTRRSLGGGPMKACLYAPRLIQEESGELSNMRVDSERDFLLLLSLQASTTYYTSLAYLPPSPSQPEAALLADLFFSIYSLDRQL